jgi:endo-1,4-beta-xylanase
MKNKLKFLGIAILSIFALLAITACDDSEDKVDKGGGSFSGETITSSSSEQVTRKSEGYDFELWNQDKQGTASMTLGSGGAFKCNWSGINNVLFRAGRKYNKTQTHSQIGTFSIDYEAPVFNLPGGSGKKNAYLSVYGWFSGGSPDALIEYYIIESLGEYNPGSASTQVGPTAGVTIDGGTYKLYKVQRTNAPSIEGNKNFVQYFSIRTQNRQSGTISVSQHFKAWADAGLTSIDNGKLYEVSLKVESYGGTAGNAIGNAEITKNILKVNNTPIQ